MIKLFGYVMDIGEQMLVAGAEVHRVEESISRMCLALNSLNQSEKPLQNIKKLGTK